LIRVGTSRDLMPGEPVVAIGNAYGYSHTVTRGIVSALHRRVKISDTQEYPDLIQTDASINPGNSGGPLLNADGELVGINVAVRAGAHGIGFALPIDDVMTVAARLLNIRQLDHTWHGVVVDERRDGTTEGLRVKSVDEASPAKQGGLLPGDVITEVENRPVTWAIEFERALLGHAPGDEITVTVLRDDQPIEAKLVLAAYPKAQHPVERMIWQRIGLELSTVQTGQFTQRETNYRAGLQVASVRAGSVAEERGIRQGDILVGMHVWEMESLENVEYLLRYPDLARISPVKFYLVRDGKPLYGFLPLTVR
jgi:serine protease Do